jgi:glutamate--cysteine ligase
MSLDATTPNDVPVTTVEALVAALRGAERPRADHRLGLEHEKFLYPVGGSTPVPYEGPAGIHRLFEMLEASGYQSFREAPGGPAIAMVKGEHTLSLEPGGQFELSGSPFQTARQAHAENLAHLALLRWVGGRLGLYPVALGYRPFGATGDIPWVPKARYQAMAKTLPARGGLALDMMLMTATGQASFDWADEADCVAKVVIAARLTPLLVALCANSPLVHGHPSGYLSYRSRVWTEVDPARCGFLPSFFDNSFSYQAYVQWALDAPLLFLRRGAHYLTPALTFRQLLQEGYEGQPALMSDWTDHLSTLFPEVRLKRVVEIRGADAVDASRTGALVALWRGLLYDPTARGEAARLLPPLTYLEHLELMEVARKEGLRGRYQRLSLAALSAEMVEIARRGLGRLDPEDAPLLEPLAELARRGRSPAEDVLEAFATDPDPARLLARFAA